MPHPLSPGRNATQADVAAAAGVSRSLVSLALSGSPKVAEATRHHIEQVAHRLGYRVNASASALARRRSTTIGVILPNLRNAFFEQVARSLDDAAAEEGLSVFMTVGAEDNDRLERAIDSLLGVRVLGLVLVSPWLSTERLRELGGEIPTVLIGQDSPGGMVDGVHLDEYDAARTVVSHLVSHGATHLAYLAPRIVDHASRAQRETALIQAAASAGLPLTIWEGDGNGAGGIIRQRLSSQGSDAESRLAPASPGGDHARSDTGVLGLIAHNDMLAIDAAAVLHAPARTDEVEQDPQTLQAATRGTVLLISYDNTYLAQRTEFALTSFAQPEGELARQAIALLLARASSPEPSGQRPLLEGRDVAVPGELVVRRTLRRA